MAVVEMVMPKMGESVMEGTILSWLKNVGEEIEADESVLEVATDKVDTEVPATHGGVLKEILANEGDVIQVGAPIALIETDEVSDDEVSTPVDTVEVKEAIVETTVHSNGQATTVDNTAASRFYSPLVLNIAREENIPMAELETVPGTGKEGRVTKKDMMSYLKTRGTKVATPAPAVKSTPAVQKKAAPKVSAAPADLSKYDGQNVEIIEMDRMRKMIASRMVESKQTSPHVTSFVEADVTSLVRWRNANKRSFKEREGGNLTFTPIFLEAVIKAIKDYPNINVSVEGDHIIKKKDINIGMAVALPSGNLIVPVIKNADHLNLTGLANKVNDLAVRARNNKLSPDELSGGTYTVSNVGSFGNVMGTPIIMQPQVGILALGAIKKKPAVIETPDGDVIAIRHQMFLSHSYDHRVVDGSLGGMFVRRVADYLEKFDADRKLV